jgi:hypothetical protein
MISDIELCDLAAQAYGPCTIDTGSIHVLLTDYKGAKVISFRGTNSPRDWLQDFVKIPFTHEHLGSIHAGFLTAVKSVWAKIPSEGPIVITGHSKGGAEAHILAGMFSAGGRQVTKLTTFGSPRSCFLAGSGLAAFLKNIPGADYCNADDPVPRVPFGWFHPRPLTQIGRRFQDLDIIEDHYLAAYRAVLEQLEVPLEPSF